METRENIERILDRAYAARLKQDLGAVLECFSGDAHFRHCGQHSAAAGEEAVRRQLQDMFDAFELKAFHRHCCVIDPPRAVVHWRGTFKAKGTGQVADTDVLDLIEIKDGKIASLATFYDTALAAQLLAV